MGPIGSPLTRRRAAIGLLLLLAGSASGCGLTDLLSPELPPRPHIAVILIDTLRADALGCYGAAHADVSPELDALAARGVRFAQVYAPCSWTRPSAGSMLTGLSPRRLGIYRQHRGILGDGALTLAEILREHGYATFGATANPHMNVSFNFHQGFDTYIDSNAVWEWMEPGPGQVNYKQSTVTPAAELFAQALEFDRLRDDGPKYVQLNLMEVHEWYRKGMDLTRDEYLSFFPDDPYRRYHRAVRQISADVGAFVETLRARPGWDDALFVIVSDHGEGLGSHPHIKKSRTHGRLLYESLLHVPFVMYRDGWKYAGRVVDRPVRLLDFMPTVLEAAGLPVPRSLDGISLMPAVRDPEATLPLPEYFVAETGLRRTHKAAVYGDGWRYYENADGHEGTAPRELQVAGSEEDGRFTSVIKYNRKQAAKMRAFLDAWEEHLPPAPPKPFKQALSEAERDQLRALGYIE